MSCFVLMGDKTVTGYFLLFHSTMSVLASTFTAWLPLCSHKQTDASTVKLANKSLQGYRCFF